MAVPFDTTANKCIGYFKIVLVGDGGTGKTSYMKRVLDGYFVTNYKATTGAEVFLVHFHVQNGEYISFEVWDTAGQELNSYLSDVYYLGSRGAIVFFDVTSRVTFTNVPKWLRRVKDVCFTDNTRIPIILVGNKVDTGNRKVKEQIVSRCLSTDIHKYYDISVKLNYNFEQPFLALARELTGRPNLIFVANLGVQPQQITVDSNYIEQGKQLMEELRNDDIGDLPEDDIL